jgi:hypothetical protein
LADAFALLCGSARGQNGRPSEFADAIVDGTEHLAPPPAAEQTR